ncbi:hypothetical protein MTR67_048256 [Solanum verrucosum]|uniref:Uncharacterized protein n=1 Tax=Solanum verrucosum TaxID=315347 RepID=A0AAF0ZX73_SOLVR|nr:hypothetical protein MTR67_048256 [Solanum verrucosum]
MAVLHIQGSTKVDAGKDKHVTGEMSKMPLEFKVIFKEAHALKRIFLMNTGNHFSLSLKTLSVVSGETRPSSLSLTLLATRTSPSQQLARRRRHRSSSARRRPPHVASPSRRSSAALPFCNLKGNKSS